MQAKYHAASSVPSSAVRLLLSRFSFKPRPRLGFLGIRLLTFLSSLPSCIIFMVYGARGFSAKSNRKLPATEQRNDNHQCNDAGYLELSMGTRFEPCGILL